MVLVGEKPARSGDPLKGALEEAGGAGAALTAWMAASSGTSCTNVGVLMLGGYRHGSLRHSKVWEGDLRWKDLYEV
jgi:hypothetical protein